MLLKNYFDYNYPKKTDTLLEKIFNFISWSIVFIILFYLTHIAVFLTFDAINYKRESNIRMEKLRKDANIMRNEFIEKARIREQIAMMERAKARDIRAAAERNELMRIFRQQNYTPVD
jgi:biopolymer transport protein ExbB/TolQ